MCIAAQDELNRLRELGLLDSLLADKTTGSNIIWATDAYADLGEAYGRESEITQELLFREPFRLLSRADKSLNAQAERTKAHAEVFTPIWIVKQMNDYVDNEWFGAKNVFESERVLFPEGKKWQDYVDNLRLEITCGEAPYLVSRYDVATGENVALGNRVGILDRKLRVVNENAANEAEWMEWTVRAYKATYGYEFQGDNLLLARLNLLRTFEENLMAKWGRAPHTSEYEQFIRIITWNIWQMDGLSGAIPYSVIEEDMPQFSLFGGGEETEQTTKRRPACRIFDWEKNETVEFRKMKEGING